MFSLAKKWGDQGPPGPPVAVTHGLVTLFSIKIKLFHSLSVIGKLFAAFLLFRKPCSENMQQIYRRTPMPKCDFKKVAKQLY